MLDADYGRARCPYRAANSGLRRARPTFQFVRKFGREIIRVQVGGDDVRFGLVKLFKIGDDAAEGGMGLLRFQIADMLTDENLVADR